MSLKTKEIITQSQVEVGYAGRTLHIRRLSELYEDDRLFQSGKLLKLGTKEEALREIFPLVIPAPTVKKFRFHANIKGQGVVTLHKGEVLYTGDIPDFALDRIDKALGSGLKFLTIHSSQNLPCKIVSPKSENSIRAFIDAILTDPVVLAWNSNPSIVLSDYTGKLKGMVVGIPAFVVAMWAEDGSPL